VKERGPGQELTLSFGSSFFCNQVFFVYDPSSSTSLLSSVSSDQGGSVREVMVVMVRGPLQELTLGRLALVGVPTDGGDHHRWPRLATPAHVLRAAAADVALLNVAEKTTAAAATSSALRRRARPWEGAHRRRRLPLAIFCDQVFFDYDPSSSTSLLSSAMGQTKAKNRNGNGGDWSETQWRCLAENQRTRWDS